MNGEKYAVVGVMPPNFEFAVTDVKLLTPIAFTAEQLADRDLHNLNVVARLKPGVTAAQANADIKGIQTDDATGSMRVIDFADIKASEARPLRTMPLWTR